MVRLKDPDARRGYVRQGFQFLMVRLKVITQPVIPMSSEISIPYGSIKSNVVVVRCRTVISIFQFLMVRLKDVAFHDIGYACLYSNSLWFD